MTDTHIKINAVTPRIQYTGNGSTTTFPYTFAIFDEDNMEVYIEDTLQESGYTVTGVGEDNGGNVVFDTAPEDGAIVTLYRNVPIERVTDFQEGGAFRPKNINDEFDRQTAFCQQIQEGISRCLQLDVTSPINPSVVIPLVERIYDSIDNIDAVADNETNINTVAGDSTNINAVAGISSSIGMVAGMSGDISTVASNSSNITSVAGNSTNINSVAGNATNINAVAGNATNINSVASNSTNINTVSTNVSDINTCAANMAAILDAPNQAAAAAASAASIDPTTLARKNTDNAFTGSNTFVTQSTSDNSQKAATTQYVKSLFQVVSALPATPDDNVFYAIAE